MILLALNSKASYPPSAHNHIRPDDRALSLTTIFVLTTVPFRSRPCSPLFHSPYGFVTWYTDYNRQDYLQRTDKVCEFAVTEGFAECSSVSHCFGNYTTLYEFDMCFETHTHANLHAMHAGMFNCAVSWKEWYSKVSGALLYFVSCESLAYGPQHRSHLTPHP